MPEKHLRYANRTPQKLIDRGYQIGEFVGKLLKEVLSVHVITEQGYRRCLGILSLKEKYGESRLNQACEIGLHLYALSYKDLKKILEQNLDQKESNEKDESKPIYHENIRGAIFYNNNLKKEKLQSYDYRANYQ